MKSYFSKLALISLLLMIFFSCKPKQVPANYPEWVKNAVIYEVNTRQYTAEGTFKAFETNLPRLKELGVDILWFMPIHPIGVEKRKVPEGMKESLGSYYSVKDYKGVNQEFGTEEDFKTLVIKAHSMGFKVIIDWVANHTAWDNAWVKEHPDWYKQDSAGNIMSAFDWTDVAKLNYDNREMRKAMIESMKYWIDKCDIDGFRCDVAGEVPADFWNEARLELEKTKPLFMLAENENKVELFSKAFDAGYGWSLHNSMHKVAQGKAPLSDIVKQVNKADSIMPKNAFQMNFVTNHDENSWNGTAWEKFGTGLDDFTILTYTLPGMPLIYSGQEAGLDKRLAFFIKDSIDWKYKDFSPFLKTLNALKHKNEALWSAPYGGTFIPIENTEPDKVLTFIREKGDYRVLVALNLSSDAVKIRFKQSKVDGEYTDVFAKVDLTVNSSSLDVKLPPWGYWVLESK
jgi:1,4-alpha-glucan branching enzyme